VTFEYLWSGISGQQIGSAGSLQPYLSAPLLTRTQAVNFAFGGSRTGYFAPIPGSTFQVPGLRAQVEFFRAALFGRRPSPRALYAIATGSNEYLVAPPETPADPQVVVRNIAAAITTLYATGARLVAVLTVPDLGQLPIIASDPETARGLTLLSRIHNRLLGSALSALETQFPDLQILRVDVDAFLADLPTDAFTRDVPALDAMFGPPAPGSPPASMCLFLDPSACPAVPSFDTGTQFLFWDAEHPTTAVHQRLGEQLAEQVRSAAALGTR
jgi:phospholipase/lecithinase/hemolysin